MKPDVELKGEPNRKPHHPQKLHLDNCTSNDPKTGQLRNGVLGAGGRTKRKAEGETYLESNETIGLRTKATKKSS